MIASVMISDPAGFDTVLVPTNGVDCSWAVRGPGTLSTDVLNRDLVAYGLNGDLRGRWIVVRNQNAGTWAGVITDSQPGSDGTTEIAAESLDALFSARRVPFNSIPLFGSAGNLALILIAEATAEHGTPIVDRTADDLGLPISVDRNGGDLRESLDSIADETGQEWWVDPDTFAFRFGVKGTDLTGTVQLVEGLHLTEWRLPTSLDPVVNDLLAYPEDEAYGSLQSLVVENPASIAAVGRRQGSASIAGGTHAYHIRNRALGLVDELASFGQAIEFDLIDENDCFSWFREGDTVCVLITSISVQLTARITARSLGRNGVMSVAGDVITRRVLP